MQQKEIRKDNNTLGTLVPSDKRELTNFGCQIGTFKTDLLACPTYPTPLPIRMSTQHFFGTLDSRRKSKFGKGESERFNQGSPNMIWGQAYFEV